MPRKRPGRKPDKEHETLRRQFERKLRASFQPGLTRRDSAMKASAAIGDYAFFFVRQALKPTLRKKARELIAHRHMIWLAQEQVPAWLARKMLNTVVEQLPGFEKRGIVPISKDLAEKERERAISRLEEIEHLPVRHPVLFTSDYVKFCEILNNEALLHLMGKQNFRKYVEIENEEFSKHRALIGMGPESN